MFYLNRMSTSRDDVDAGVPSSVHLSGTRGIWGGVVSQRKRSRMLSRKGRVYLVSKNIINTDIIYQVLTSTVLTINSFNASFNALRKELLSPFLR